MSVYLIAECGSTSDGSLGNALEMVRLWAGYGADAVKFQDHRWEHVPVDQPHPNTRVRETRREYYERTSFMEFEWDQIAAACRGYRVDLIVSPFSVEAANSHQERVSKFKVASGQVTNEKLLARLSGLGKPVLLSTGMTTADENQAAVAILGNALECVLVCTSEYPCLPRHVGLNRLGSRTRFGLSDHTMGMAASLAAVALGATVIERHVTPSRELYGSDAAHSLEPHEFQAFERELRDLEEMLANPVDNAEAVKRMAKTREVFLCAGE